MGDYNRVSRGYLLSQKGLQVVWALKPGILIYLVYTLLVPFKVP